MTYLGLSGLSVMTRNSDLIKETMQLPNDRRNLRGQVTGVHCEVNT